MLVTNDVREHWHQTTLERSVDRRNGKMDSSGLRKAVWVALTFGKIWLANLYFKVHIHRDDVEWSAYMRNINLTFSESYNGACQIHFRVAGGKS